MKNIKKFKEYNKTNENIYMPEVEKTPHIQGTSYEIKYPHNEFKPGTNVEVSIYADKHNNKKGVIAPPTKMGNKTDTVFIDFEDGTSAYIPITDINRI
jgi:hypothetical protein